LGHPQDSGEAYSLSVPPLHSEERPSHHIVNNLYITCIVGDKVPNYFYYRGEININGVKLASELSRIMAPVSLGSASTGPT